MAMSTLLLPFTLYLHLFFDDNSSFIDFMGFRYYHSFFNNQAFAWYVLSNTIGLLTLVLIYINSSGKWRWCLLPILGNFFCALLYGFSNSEKYALFSLKPVGVSFLIITSLLMYALDKQVKSKIQGLVSIPKQTIFKEFINPSDYNLNIHLNRLIRDKSKFSLKEYAYRIYYLNQLVKKRQNNYSFVSQLSFSNVKNKGMDLILGTLTLLILALLFLDNFIPPDKTNMNIGGIEISSFGFYDVKTFLWFISQKLSLCLLTIIWLITSVKWWRWAILSPIIFYSYQFWETFQPVETVDGSGNLNVFPLVFLTILGVFLLSKVIRRISVNLDYQVFLEEELDKSIGELSKLE